MQVCDNFICNKVYKYRFKVERYDHPSNIMCMYVQKYIHKKAQKVLFTHHLLFHELCNSLAFFLIIKPNPIYGHCKCTSNTNYEHLLKQQFYLVHL